MEKYASSITKTKNFTEITLITRLFYELRNEALIEADTYCVAH